MACHSVRAVVGLLARERRAEDCPPYQRRCVNLNVNCHMFWKAVKARHRPIVLARIPFDAILREAVLDCTNSLPVRP